MSIPRLDIVDVGHGNAAVLYDKNCVYVFDTGRRQRLLRYLLAQEVDVIDGVFISHADADHMAGIIDVLCCDKIETRSVFVNPDLRQASDLWESVRHALSDANRRSELTVFSANTGINPHLQALTCGIEIVNPDVSSALGCAPGDRHTHNVVIRLLVDSNGWVLLPGDISHEGLHEIRDSDRVLTAKLMVFPHHGGLPGGGRDPVEFTLELCALVEAQWIVFSVADGQSNHPRQDVVQTIAGHHEQATLLSTGRADAIQALVDSNPDSRHKNGTGHIEVRLEERHLTLTFEKES